MTDYRLTILYDTSQLGEVHELAKQTGRLSFDLETSGLDPYTCHPLLLQIGVESPKGCLVYILQASLIGENDKVYLKALFEDESIVKIAHNASFDYKFLLHWYGVEVNNIWDTQIVEACLTLGKGLKNSLQEVAKRRLGIFMEKVVRNSFAGRKQTTTFTEREIDYAARDVAVLFPIYHSQKSDVEAAKLTRVVELENRVVPITAELELNGVLIDLDKWTALTAEFEQETVQVLEKIYEMSGCQTLVQTSFFDDARTRIEALSQAMNINNPDTVKRMLNSVGVAVPDTRKETLKGAKGQHALVDEILSYRKMGKLLSSFMYPIPLMKNPVSGRWHVSYIQLPTFDDNNDSGGATSGRYASSQFNFQQLPQNNDIRTCFIARPGYKIITADYSSMEVRIAVNFSAKVTGQADRDLVEFFLGDFHDFHGYIASKVFHKPLADVSKMVIDGVEVDPPLKNLRNIAKTCTFGLFYGATAAGLAPKIGLSENEAQEVIDSYRKSFPRLMKTLDYFGDFAGKNNITRDCIGRIKFFNPGDDVTIYRIQRQGKNFPIQASNASITKLALYYCRKYFSRDDLKLYATVHDEIVAEVREEIAEEVAPKIRELMIQAADALLKGPVPYDASYRVENSWVK